MYRTLLLLFVVLLMPPSKSKAQVTADYIIYYDFMCVSDTASREFWSPREYMLIGVDKKSTFITSGRYYNDSMHMEFEKEYPEPDFKSQGEVEAYMGLYMKKRSVRSVGSDHKIFKDFDAASFRLLHPVEQPVVFMEESMDLEWELTNEVDTILGLSCLKAITEYGGRHYFAWFSVDIPINNGPWTFQGLPGLILRIMDTQGWYTFTATRMTTKASQRYLKPDWVNQYSREIDRKTMVDKLTNLKHNPGVPMGILNFSEEQMLRRKKAYAKRFDLVLEQY